MNQMMKVLNLNIFKIRSFENTSLTCFEKLKVSISKASLLKFLNSSKFQHQKDLKMIKKFEIMESFQPFKNFGSFQSLDRALSVQNSTKKRTMEM